MDQTHCSYTTASAGPRPIWTRRSFPVNQEPAKVKAVRLGVGREVTLEEGVLLRGQFDLSDVTDVCQSKIMIKVISSKNIKTLTNKF